MAKIVVVDLGTGNLRSVAKAVEHVSPKDTVLISHLPEVIKGADRVVLPGQGAIGTWMKQMEQEHIREAIAYVVDSRPVLGVCLGLQALFGRSEENGGTDCLNILPGEVLHFSTDMQSDGTRLKIPHMGWNNVTQVQNHPLWDGIENKARFYFVHSYYAQSEAEVEVGRCEYGVPFTAAAAKDNLFAVQFHPEKSQHDGLKLIENFVTWNV